MKRYYSFSQYLKETFPGIRVYKIAVDAGFTCPNRDGKVGTGGCTYCDNRSFSPNARLSERLPLRSQIERGMDFYRRRYRAEKFIIYFQAFSNTYGPPEKLKQLYDEAVSFNDVVGLSIGTRPDCISEEILDLIAKYTDKYLVWLEYGIQSVHNKTLELINRGHTYEDFVNTVKMTKDRNIKIATHIILGLPGETKEDMIVTAQQIGLLGIDGIKLHHLYIAKDTPLEKWYAEGKVKLMNLEEYIPLVCDILENLPEGMIVQRLMGELSSEPPPGRTSVRTGARLDTRSGGYLIAPKWNTPKSKVLSLIEQELARHGSYQGRLFPKCGVCVPR